MSARRSFGSLLPLGFRWPRLFCWLAFAAAVLSAVPAAAQQSGGVLELRPGDKVILLGNALAERMQYFGYFETLLHSRFPKHQLVVRNLGWSGDELTIQMRSKDFQDHGHRLEDHKPDVILAFWGFNESFAGPQKVHKFMDDLTRFVKKITSTKYNGKEPPRLVLISPVAYEQTDNSLLPDWRKLNTQLEIYTGAMRRVAQQQGVGFVDLFHPTARAMQEDKKPWTINGVHLSRYGYRQLAPILDEALFGPRAPSLPRLDQLEALHREVQEKNRQFFYDYRAVNGYYIYGGRKKPFGVVNFPPEFAKLRRMIAKRDRRIWRVAQGLPVPEKIDDSDTGPLPKIPSNVKNPAPILPTREAIKRFTLPEGYQVRLFASEEQFPELQNPVAMTFDSRGRLWVATNPSYPMISPGQEPNDKILILEDVDGDGRADRCKVFADKLYLPIGFELGDGGVYVSAQPNLLFLKDTDGDDRADVRELILHGFDSCDSHHAISAFEWGPGGALYFQEGTFFQSSIETPYGPVRLSDAGVYRFEPRSWRLEVFVSYRFANPWGHVFDHWGQNFVADASGGANYFGTAFSGAVDFPRKHPGMKQFLVKQWRPTCGCEIVSSRNFPEEVQGDYLLNNCIGFQGVLQYRRREEGSGFFAEPVPPLLRSSDPTFRPVDLQFGPEGALYVLDWCNPLIGHMQHSIRDPNRDHTHGRVWRIHYTRRPLVKPPRIAGAPVPELLELLKEPELRTRYRVRRELRDRPTGQVVRELHHWVKAQDPKDPNYWHHLLEALWVHQHHHAVNPELLKKLLTCPEPRARAAATRVLCYWRREVPDALKLLQQQVNDGHPRVRLEAVRALSFFEGKDAQQALDIAVESLVHPQDYYLEYTLKETIATLEGRIKQYKELRK